MDDDELHDGGGGLTIPGMPFVLLLPLGLLVRVGELEAALAERRDLMGRPWPGWPGWRGPHDGDSSDVIQ